MPTTFDFAAYAVISKTLGAKKVWFVHNGDISERKYPKEYAWRRWANICMPICRLAGLGWHLGPLEDPLRTGFTHWYHYGVVQEVYRRNGSISLLRSIAQNKEPGYVTCTIRDSIRNKWRDSNLPAWKRFIEFLEKRHRVKILGDCEFAPLSIEYRMAEYSGAEMNFGSSNGPMALCHFSKAPYITFNVIPIHNPENAAERLKTYMANGGFPYGSQFDFRTDQQMFDWEPETFERMKRGYEWWMDTKKGEARLPDSPLSGPQSS